MPTLNLPPNYPCIRRVGSFHELVTTPLVDGVNALCWERTLPGDFDVIVAQLGDGVGVVTLDEARLLALQLSAAGRAAIEVMLADLRLLREHELDPVLNCIYGYPRDEQSGTVHTDVFSYHADSAPVPTDTWLCSYYGATSEGLRNEEALRQVDIAATRAELLQRFGGDDNEEFRTYLAENCYDLHYAPVAGARPFAFGLGNLWRIACDYPDSPVPPCVHRAPPQQPGDPPRLLLIS